VIKAFKKKVWTFKNEYNTKWWNCERANKGIEKIVYSCVDFACATFGPLHHAFTQKLFTFTRLYTTIDMGKH
jgi:hypothetical protein